MITIGVIHRNLFDGFLVDFQIPHFFTIGINILLGIDKMKSKPCLNAELLSTKLILLKDSKGRPVKLDVESIKSRIPINENGNLLYDGDIYVCFADYLSIQPTHDSKTDLFHYDIFKINSLKDSKRKIERHDKENLSLSVLRFISKIKKMLDEKGLERSSIITMVIRDISKNLNAKGHSCIMETVADKYLKLTLKKGVFNKKLIGMLKYRGWKQNTEDKDILEFAGIRISVPMNSKELNVIDYELY